MRRLGAPFRRRRGRVVTRRIVWITLALIVLGALGSLWFMDNFERRPVKTRVPPEAEARRNPYLALERFLGRMGRPLKREGDPRFLDRLPAGGVVILDVNRRAQMTPARIDQLLAWVGRGGYLIAAAELPGLEDPLLARFDLRRWGEAKKPAPADDDEEDDDGESTPGPEASATPGEAAQRPPEPTPAPAAAPTPTRPTPARRVTPPRVVTVAIPGAARPLTTAFLAPGLQPGRRTPAWSADAPEAGAQLVHFSHGAGQVTFVAGLPRRLSNLAIGQHDHAELIWTLVQTYQPDTAKPIHLLTRLTVQRLWDWLIERAWAVLVAGALLLGLWLWRVVPRFGTAQPEPEPDRRQLREHLTALGLYLWRRGGLDHWLAVARDAFQSRLARRHPALAGLPPARQAEALAQLTHRPVALIAAALHGPATTATAFTHALRTLRNLERSL